MPVIASSGIARAGCAVGPRTNGTASATHADAAMSALSEWRPGSSSGLLPIVPRSLPNAMTEPVKVTAPTRTPT